MAVRLFSETSEHITETDLAAMETENNRLRTEIAELRLQLLDLERAADTDPLIPVYNRRAFMREVTKAQSVMDRYDIASSMIFFDLNGFKKINDQYGHLIGDELLTNIGLALSNAVRDCDVVARLGGDEFGVLLFKMEKDLAKIKASALACRIAEQSIDMGNETISVSAAWGIAACTIEKTADQILATADRAMYKAKTWAATDDGA